MIEIGSLSIEDPIFLAPLAGVTNLNYRLLARGCGCSLAFTEMVSANGLVRHAPQTFEYLDSLPADRPLGIQIFGADPTVMAEAARIIGAKGADLLDINMGCPVKKVIKTGAGAALMRSPENVRAILAAVRKATALPLTVKIRAGWRQGEINAPEIARIAQGEGVDAVIVHPRTVDQGFSGTSDWQIIRDVKLSLKIPVIGNGDIRVPQDALRMVEETGCDAVMIGRASLGNPWIFREILSLMRTGEKACFPSLREREAIICRHLNMELAYLGDAQGLRNFRKHLLWYTKGFRGGAQIRQYLGRIDEREALVAAIHDYFSALRDEAVTSAHQMPE